jgi:hypothetical protein
LRGGRRANVLLAVLVRELLDGGFLGDNEARMILTARDPQCMEAVGLRLIELGTLGSSARHHAA